MQQQVQQGGASTFTSGRQHQGSNPATPANHGSSPRTWQRRPEAKQGQPEGLNVEHGLQGKGGPAGLLGWPATSGRNRGAWVPDPAHRAEPMLTTSQVLGSLPWLFVHLLASRKATNRKASTSILRTPTARRKGIVDKARDVSSALPVDWAGFWLCMKLGPELTSSARITVLLQPLLLFGSTWSWTSASLVRTSLLCRVTTVPRKMTWRSALLCPCFEPFLTHFALSLKTQGLDFREWSRAKGKAAWADKVPQLPLAGHRETQGGDGNSEALQFQMPKHGRERRGECYDEVTFADASRMPRKGLVSSCVPLQPSSWYGPNARA